MFKFSKVNATTVADASATLAKGKAQVLAGGTDLLPYMKGMFTPNPPTTLVNIKNIASLDYIKVEGGTLKIGALTSLTDIAASADVKNGWAVLAQAAKAVGGP
jgi:CO/xanthine dehydrogenase FAD-binding subunit